MSMSDDSDVECSSDADMDVSNDSNMEMSRDADVEASGGPDSEALAALAAALAAEARAKLSALLQSKIQALRDERRSSPALAVLRGRRAAAAQAIDVSSEREVDGGLFEAESESDEEESENEDREARQQERIRAVAHKACSDLARLLGLETRVDIDGHDDGEAATEPWEESESESESEGINWEARQQDHIREVADKARAKLASLLVSAAGQTSSRDVTVDTVVAQARSKLAAVFQSMGINVPNRKQPAYFVKLDLVLKENADAPTIREQLSEWMFTYGVYIVSFGDLTEWHNGKLIFSEIGRWLGTLGPDPLLYEGSELVKFGFTDETFFEWIPDCIKTVKASGFPQRKVRVVVKGLVVGLPSEPDELRFAEGILKNTLARRQLRAYHHVHPFVKVVPATYGSKKAEKLEFASWNEKTAWYACAAAENIINVGNGVPMLTGEERRQHVRRLEERMRSRRSTPEVVQSIPRCRIPNCKRSCTIGARGKRMSVCEVHRQQQAKARLRWYNKRKRMNKCVDCGGECARDDNNKPRLRCKSCLVDSNKRHRQSRQRVKALRFDTSTISPR